MTEHHDLLTLDEAAEVLRLRTGETFARFARRHGIPLVQIGSRVVRVRSSDLERAIEQNTVHADGRVPTTENHDD